MRWPLGCVVGALVACRGGAPTVPTPQGDAESRFGPLEIGRDYASYVRVTDEPYRSTVHGDRMVHVWVTPGAAEAYLHDEQEMPVGAIVVKTSVEADGKPGPVFVMEKRAPGYAPEHGDWYYAMHWAEPSPMMRVKLGGPVYWRGRSSKIAYCYDCHDGNNRGLGGLTPSSVLPR